MLTFRRELLHTNPMLSQTTFRRMFLLGMVWIALPAAGTPFGQEPSTRPRKIAVDSQTAPKTSVKQAEATPKAPTSKASVEQLIEQGKVHYRAARFPQALAKFEAALKVDPSHDEALGLAAITAFRVDNQEQARQWFLRRAELPGQKASVKAFSYYRIALSHWRRLHDPVARGYSIKDGKVQFKLADADTATIRENFEQGLTFAERALQVNANYSEAHNVRNLLYAEAALAASNEADARTNRTLALDSVRRAIKLQLRTSERSEGETANFNLPTVRIGEIPRTPDEETKFVDEMRKHLEGVLPVKRVSPVFPSTRPAKAKETKDPSSTGVTDKGGAYSIGSGRGALTAAYAPGTVKLEVLISTAGDVVFAHVIDGRADLNGAAILAARGWRFTPAKFEGTSVQVSGVITFDMKPSGSRAAPTPTPTPKKGAQ